MNKQLVVALIGQVSSGKTSLLNAFTKFINPVSMRRETYQVFQYMVNCGDDTPVGQILSTINQIRTQNKQLRKGIGKIQPNPVLVGNVSSLLFNRPLMLLDFPGLNDSQDSENKFFGFIETNKDLPHIFMFITSIESAFNHGSELKYFERVLEIVKKQNSEGIYAEIIVVVNKYDDDYDKEYEDILANLPDIIISNAKIFRISSHRLLCRHIEQSGESFQAPDDYKREFSRIIRNSGAVHGEDFRVQFTGIFDANDLLGYVNGIDVRAEEYKHMFRMLIEYDLIPDKCGKLSDKLVKLYDLNPQFGEEPGFVGWVADMMKKFDQGDVPYSIIREFLMCVCNDPRLDAVVRGSGVKFGDDLRLIVESIINLKGRNIDPECLTKIIRRHYNYYRPRMAMDGKYEIWTEYRDRCVKCGQMATLMLDRGEYYCDVEMEQYDSECCVCKKKSKCRNVCWTEYKICESCTGRRRSYHNPSIVVPRNTVAFNFKENPGDQALKRIKALCYISWTEIELIVTIHAASPELFTPLFQPNEYKEFVVSMMQLYHTRHLYDGEKILTLGELVFCARSDEEIDRRVRDIFGKGLY